MATMEPLQEVEIRRRQIANGEWISHEDFMKEPDEEFPDESPIYRLPPKVRRCIERSLQQLNDGKTIPGETVFREIDEWLGDD